MKTYVIDIDGTICSDSFGQYEKAEPIKSRIDFVNKLYLEGNQIIFFTARGMKTFENNVNNSINKWEELTKKQLDAWGVRYHKLILGKPAADLYIDDKGINDKVFFKDLN
jgi:capsule biosynthesis phosphatase